MSGAGSDPAEFIQSVYSHYIIIGCAVGGIVWGAINAHWVSSNGIAASPGPPRHPCSSLRG